jgi:hypothetical protein
MHGVRNAVRNRPNDGLVRVRDRESTVKIIIEKGPGRGDEFRLLDGINMLGRDVSNRIRVLDPKVSRKHCKIRKIGQSLFVYDLTTKNGTLVNGRSVTEHELEIGDEVKVGGTILKVVDDDYIPRRRIRRPSPVSFFRNITMAVLSRRGRETEQVPGYGFAKFERKSGRLYWRPSVETDPPEASSETLISQSDPDE